MVKSDDIVVLAEVRSRLIAARSRRQRLVEIRRFDPGKGCNVLLFAGRKRPIPAA